MYLSGMEGIFSGSPFPSPDGSQMERSGDVAGEWEALAVSSPRPSGASDTSASGRPEGWGRGFAGKAAGGVVTPEKREARGTKVRKRRRRLLMYGTKKPKDMDAEGCPREASTVAEAWKSGPVKDSWSLSLSLSLSLSRRGWSRARLHLRRVGRATG